MNSTILDIITGSIAVPEDTLIDAVAQSASAGIPWLAEDEV